MHEIEELRMRMLTELLSVEDSGARARRDAMRAQNDAGVLRRKLEVLDGPLFKRLKCWRFVLFFEFLRPALQAHFLSYFARVLENGSLSIGLSELIHGTSVLTARELEPLNSSARLIVQAWPMLPTDVAAIFESFAAEM